MLSRILLMAIAAGWAAIATSGGLAENFRNPPQAAYPQIWFQWNGSAVTRGALTRDIEAIAKAGFRTAIVIVPAMMRPPFSVEMMSDQWLELFDFALAEAKRCGITLGAHNCPGWSSAGGPWITPENSMKVVVSSVKDLMPGESAGVLPMPTVRGFYREIATLAFPVVPVPSASCSAKLPLVVPLKDEPAEGYAVEWTFERAFEPSALTLAFRQGNVNTLIVVEGSDGPSGAWRELGRLDQHYYLNPPHTPKTMTLKSAPVRRIRLRFLANAVPEWQGGKPVNLDLTSVRFDTAPMFAAADIRTSASGRDLRYVPPSDPNGRSIAADSILDLSAKLDTQGNLDWIAPVLSDGRVWRVLRLGYTSTGKCCAPATIRGLECDKLSRRGIEAHWKAMPARLLKLPHAKGTLDYLFIDSWEADGQNWTEGFPDEFRRDRGYALHPWLPLYAGYVVRDATKTAKALYDIQRVVSNLICKNYYGRFAELCREAGVRSGIQPYGGPYDMFQAGTGADEPEGEFWYVANGETSECDGSSRLVASIAHLFGRPIASAEAFTSEAKPGRWQMTPASLRIQGDRRWLQGLNRLTLHGYVHQPWEVKPGLSLGRHGCQFNRHLTWWPEMSAWMDYLKRGQTLLQAGKPDVDILVYRGCARNLYGRDYQEVTDAGYSFDICESFGLRQYLSVISKNGDSAVGDGTPTPPELSYSMIFVGDNDYLSIAELKTIAALAKCGVRIAGACPQGSPTLMDDAAEWQTLVGEIWGGGLVKPQNDLLAAIRETGIRPCLDATDCLSVYRRKLGGGADGRIFFVVNRTNRPFKRPMKFAAKGEGAIYDAVRGTITPYAGELSLMPGESTFVVFGADATEIRLDNWTIVRFEGNDAPSAPLTMPTLKSWTEFADPKLKYFAGRALYECEVKAPAAAKTAKLDLGEVHDIANVYVNGKKIATLWCAPYRCEIPWSPEVRLGVEVVNTWPNRLIGDALIRREKGKEKLGKCDFPEWVLDRRDRGENGVTTWSNFDWAFSADEPLRPAGLLGPVKLSL